MAEARKARAKAVRAGDTQYQVSVPSGKGSRVKTYWISKCKAPVVIARSVELQKQKRPELRPSQLARAQGKRRAREILESGTFDGSRTGWAGSENMPDEECEEDTGWGSLVVHRMVPPFKGGKPGLKRHVNANTPAHEFICALVTDDLCTKLLEYGVAHCKHYRAMCHMEEQTVDTAECIERSVRDPEKLNAPTCIRIWLAAKHRVAQLAPEVPAKELWDPCSPLYDADLCGALTYNQYQWFQRHISFSEYTPQGELLRPGDAGYDRYRKRRMAIDKINQICQTEQIPGQMLGADEAARANKHWGRIRIRFKASIHSGNLNDSLNDCDSGESGSR